MIRALLLSLVLTGCNPFHLKWTPPDGTVVEREIEECEAQGGGWEWTNIGCVEKEVETP